MQKIEQSVKGIIEQRDQKIDILKGIAITCVVAGHAQVFCRGFLYLFHMAVFFMASGYLFKDINADNFTNVLKFVKRKVITLWLPYVLWTIIFSACNNLFIYTNIYTDNPLLLHSVSGEYVNLHQKWSLITIIKNIIKGFFFQGSTEMGGALWFLSSLFEISILFCAIQYLLKKMFRRKTLLVTQAIIAVAFLAVGFFLSNRQLSLWGISRVFSAYSLFYLGYVIKEILNRVDIREWLHILLGVVSLILLITLNYFGTISLGNNQYVNPVFLIIASLAGWWFLFEIARYIDKLYLLRKIVSNIGRNSLSIVILHFLAFKIVTLVIILVTNKSPYLLAAFPILSNDWYWCVAYIIVGVTVPILLNGLWRKISIFLKKKLDVKKKRF